MIVSLLNLQSNVGKTTLAVNFAHQVYLRLKKNNVVLIDTDPKADAMKWLSKRTGKQLFPIISMSGKLFKKQVHLFKRLFDFIFIDTQPNSLEAFDHTVCISDLIIIPSGQCVCNIKHANKSIELTRKEIYNLDNTYIRKVVISNSCYYDDSECSYCEEYLGHFHARSLNSLIRYSKTIEDSSKEGKFIFEMNPRGIEMNMIGKAFLELPSLWY
ncbi:MAG: hypothetical protein ACOC3T_06025 [Bacteroidota bacterium]